MYLFLGKMATANPDEADFTCKNPNCPKGIFQWNTILAHVVRAKTCKAFYTEENIKALKEEQLYIEKKLDKTMFKMEKLWGKQ